MPSRPFAVIQTVPVPKGTEEFEAKRRALVDAFNVKVPEEYYIPEHYIRDPPLDVTRIPRECGILSELDLEITENHDAWSLAQAIAIRKYTSLQVAEAFVKRAIVCHQISCCLTQWFPEKAYEQAKALDEHLARTGKTIGPLHGVPISIKQHMPMADTESDIGDLASTVLDTKDSLMVSILRKAGAVFYVKTQQPQLIMHLESDSHYGRVLNPHNIHLSAGGSSGGEAALIALRGSVLGVGSDIGGSIRGPAGFSGIYGFKPTSYTLPMKDFIAGGAAAELNILASTGPMCNTLRDMEFFMHLVLEQKPYIHDARLVPIPWTGLKTDIGISTEGPLKVGIMLNDGVIKPQPPVLRALEWAKKRLATSSLIDLKPYTPNGTSEAMTSIRQMYWPQGQKAMKHHLEASGEPLHILSKYILAEATQDQQNAEQITAQRVKRDAFRCTFSEDWDGQDVDVVLCPMYVGPAAAHDTSYYWNYTAIWNYVDCPGVVFPTPIRAKKKGEERYDDDGKAWNASDAYVRRLWDEVDYEGAPIALQLVARKYFDNYLFGALDVLKGPLGLL